VGDAGDVDARRVNLGYAGGVGPAGDIAEAGETGDVEDVGDSIVEV
jgi:hypothetical protein